MSDYDNTNSGVLYRNDNKTNERQPDHRGSINIEGTDYWLSAWIKTAGPSARNPGSKFFSLAVTPKEDQTPQRPTTRVDYNPETDDDVPF